MRGRFLHAKVKQQIKIFRKQQRNWAGDFSRPRRDFNPDWLFGNLRPVYLDLLHSENGPNDNRSVVNQNKIRSPTYNFQFPAPLALFETTKERSGEYTLRDAIRGRPRLTLDSSPIILDCFILIDERRTKGRG